jgi:NTE family protein
VSGYTFQRVAGTSAGSIVGAFVAAGLDAAGLQHVMGELDYSRVPDRARPGIPLASETISLLAKGGAHPGDYAYNWIRDQLERVGVSTFGDLRIDDAGADRNLPASRRYRLVVMTTDITHGRLLRLPWDYGLFDLDPDQELVADAVRASMSIPLYFEPRHLRNGRTGEVSTLVDGGVLSNFPVEIFDRTDGKDPRWPTFAVKVIPALPGADAKLFPALALPTLRPVRELEQVLATAIVGHDQTYTEQPCVRQRIVDVDTSAVGVIEFGADEASRARVFNEGEAAAARFLESWDWNRYRSECRGAGGDSEAQRERPRLGTTGGQIAATRAMARTQRLLTLDELWTMQVAAAATPERNTPGEDPLALEALVSELQAGLNDAVTDAAAIGSMLSELSDEDFDRALLTISASPILSPETSQESLPGPDGYPSRSDLMSACDHVRQGAAGETAVLGEKLAQLQGGDRPGGDLGLPFRCAATLMLLAAGVISSIGLGGAPVFVGLGVASSCGFAAKSWVADKCPTVQLGSRPGAEPPAPGPAPSPASPPA